MGTRYKIGPTPNLLVKAMSHEALKALFPETFFEALLKTRVFENGQVT